jgi:hypothetical protein
MLRMLRMDSIPMKQAIVILALVALTYLGGGGLFVQKVSVSPLRCKRRGS